MEFLNDLWLFALAVIFVCINGITQLSWAVSLGYKLKLTAFAYIVGALGNLVTGSVTPIAGQAETLTVSSLMRNLRERIAALLMAAIVMIILGLVGGVSAIANFAGPAVVSGMMAGVGLLLTSAGIEMVSQEKRTGIISMVSALIVWGFTKDVVYTVAGSVMLSTLDFVFLQAKEVDLAQNARENGYDDQIQSANWKFWTKEYWFEFELIRPSFTGGAILGTLGFICLNIGSNTAFGNITASMAGTTQNLDHLTIINSLADIPSVLFGGAPIEAIISGTAAAPWPVAASITMMLLTAILLLCGLVNRVAKYVPAQSIAGFLFI